MKKKLFSFLITIVLLIGGETTIVAQTLVSTTSPISDWSSTGTGLWVIGDFNNDGAIDVLAQSGGTGTVVTLYTNNGSGSYSSSTAIAATPNLNLGAAKAADFDNDGDLDLLVVVNGASNDLYYQNNGAGVFTLTTSPISDWASSGTSLWVTGDFNNDGAIDVLTQVSNAGTVTLYTNNGSGSFSSSTAIAATTNLSLGAAKAADYDNDGDLDLLVVVNGASNDLYYQNNGSGIFTLTTSPITDWASTGTSLWLTGDFNNDGAIDVLTQVSADGAVTLNTNNGSGSFTTSTAIVATTGLNMTAAKAADYDNDGDIDLLIVVNGASNDFYFQNSSTPPRLVSFIPTSNATGVGKSDNIVLTFSNSSLLSKGSGTISIKVDDGDGNYGIDVTFETFAATDARVALTGDASSSSCTINPSGTFASATTYYLVIRPTAFVDANGKGFTTKIGNRFHTGIPDPSIYQSGNSLDYVSDRTLLSFTTSVAAPIVSSISPTRGLITGGTSVVITGTNLTGATAVMFGATSASSYTVNTATQITSISPAGSVGTIDITVTTAGGTSATGSGDQFTYLTPGTWTGTTDTNWGTGTNWSGGSVPTSATDVTIPSGLTNYPTISATTSADCNNLTVISGGSLTIESTASGTGSLIVSGTPTGDVTCQRYMTGGKWHLVSATAAGGSISTFIQAAGNAIPSKDVSGTLNYGMMDYNETPNLWFGYFTAATPGNLVAGKGYSLRRTGDGIVTFTGTLTSGTKTVSLTKAGEGWNCVGNPYTSAINMNTAASASNNFLKTNAIDASNLDLSYACLYVWDDAVAGYKILGNSSYGGRDLGQNVFAPGQGFFVKANNSGSSVQFTAAMQTHLPATALKAAQGSWPGFELTATSGIIKASTVVAFNNAMTNGLDPTYDAGLLRGSSGISVYTRLVEDNGVDFAIQCLPYNQNKSLIIPLGLDCTKGGNIHLSATTNSWPKTCIIILEDRTTKTFTQIDKGKELIATVADNTKGIGRFFIHIINQSIDTSTMHSNGTLRLKVYQTNGLIWIIGEVNLTAKAYLYDIKGRTRGTFNLQEGSINTISTQGLSQGIYLLNVTEGKNRFTTKVMLFRN